MLLSTGEHWAVFVWTSYTTYEPTFYVFTIYILYIIEFTYAYKHNYISYLLVTNVVSYLRPSSY